LIKDAPGLPLRPPVGGGGHVSIQGGQVVAVVPDLLQTHHIRPLEAQQLVLLPT
jgi:hypothetical protein